ncbi:class I SAM-dependent methyltransferase, partial [bacterium]|nr:class I SAM-dependent methyltransferase [bacterium]
MKKTVNKDKTTKATRSLRRSLRNQFPVLGPVVDLETHVSPDWWRGIFNRLYLKTDADVIDDLQITKEEIDYFTQILNVDASALILDLACGQGRHTLELARRGYDHLEGLDRSRYLIQRAKTVSKKERLDVKFREGDARKIPHPVDHFDVVMILGNSFGYFENPHDDEKVLKEALRVLKPDGQLLLDITDGDFISKNFQPRSWEWIDKKHFVCRERSLSHDERRLISREVITHVERGVIADQFYGERLYSKERLEKLLLSCKFDQIEFQGEMKPKSQRMQDLGMMEMRLIVNARAKKEWAPVKKKIDKELKNIVVILGDPQKKDKVKPDAVFDEDDFYTIDQLKNALSKVDQYRFTFLDNHIQLLDDLIKLKSK